ncbi:MAG: hypothetical protein Q8N05_19480 [Bacteroidota bacterium]|nr:hypothetical protein [Bacteroidota bacterium]
MNFANWRWATGINSSDSSILEILSPTGKGLSTASWVLAQWASKYNLYGAKPQKQDDGKCRELLMRDFSLKVLV